MKTAVAFVFCLLICLSEIWSGVHSRFIAARPVQKSIALGGVDFGRLLLGSDGILNKILAGVMPYSQGLDGPTYTFSTDKVTRGAKTIKQFLTNLRNTEFGDPDFPTLPSLGVCDQVSCEDLYKELEKFRRSEDFLNLQIFLQLLQSEEGLQTLFDFLSQPEIVASFLNKPTKPEISLSIDGEGDDIAAGYDGLPSDYGALSGDEFKNYKSRPEIATSLDLDYYDGVDNEEPTSFVFVEKTLTIPSVSREKTIGITPPRIGSRRGRFPTSSVNISRRSGNNASPPPIEEEPETTTSTTLGPTTTPYDKEKDEYYAMYYN